ncbi:hypothetical protein, partial [Helicobacter pylori]|uniref:hypothetical protein n=1 Tax=Helicobacter pylori TaxID=210 RepID=UPI0039E1026F
LRLANAKTDEVVIRQYYNALLDATDLDFTNKENAKSLVMWIFSIEDSIDQLKKEQAHLTEAVVSPTKRKHKIKTATA